MHRALMPVAPVPLLWLPYKFLTCAILALVLDMLSAVLPVDTLDTRCGSNFARIISCLWWGSLWDDPSFFREAQVLIAGSGEADDLTLWGHGVLLTAGPRAALPSHSSRVRAPPSTRTQLSPCINSFTRFQSSHSALTDTAVKRQEAFLTIWDEMSKS